jgi:hypothetical protein
MRFIALTLLALLLTQCGGTLPDAKSDAIDYHIDLHKMAAGDLRVDATFNAPGEFQIAELKVADTNVICEVAGRAFGCGGLDFGFVRNTCSGVIKTVPPERVVHVVWRTSRQEEEAVSLEIPAIPQLTVRSQLFKHGSAESVEVDFGPEFRLAEWSSCALYLGDRERVEVVTQPTSLPAEILNRMEKSPFDISMRCTRAIDRTMKRDTPEFHAPTYRSGRRVVFSFESEKVSVTKQ